MAEEYKYVEVVVNDKKFTQKKLSVKSQKKDQYSIKSEEMLKL